MKNEMEYIQCLMQLDVETLNKMLETDLTDDERIDVVAIRILKEYKRAFEELAK